MRNGILILIVMITLFTGCDRAIKGMEVKEKAEEDTPQISINSVQTAVSGLLIEAGVSHLDDSYEEIDTREEVLRVTAGEGKYSLYNHLSTRYPFAPACDISRDGKVTVH